MSDLWNAYLEERGTDVIKGLLPVADRVVEKELARLGLSWKLREQIREDATSVAQLVLCEVVRKALPEFETEKHLVNFVRVHLRYAIREAAQNWNLGPSRETKKKRRQRGQEVVKPWERGVYLSEHDANMQGSKSAWNDVEPVEWEPSEDQAFWGSDATDEESNLADDAAEIVIALADPQLEKGIELVLSRVDFKDAAREVGLTTSEFMARLARLAPEVCSRMDKEQLAVVADLFPEKLEKPTPQRNLVPNKKDREVTPTLSV